MESTNINSSAIDDRRKIPTAAVFFSGAGGASLGIEKAGFKIVLAVDSNDRKVPCCESHKANFPETETIKADLENFDSIPVVDWAHFSPPCKLLSSANTSTKNTKEGMKLVNRSVEIIQKVKPRFWSIENVPGEILNELHLPYYILDAADYGVPQNRRRVFFTNIPRPRPTHSEFGGSTLDGRNLEKWISTGEALGIAPGSSLLGARTISNKAHSPYFSSDRPASTVTSVPFSLMQEPNCSDGTKKALDKPSYTIRTSQNNGLILAWKFSQESHLDWRTRELSEPSPTINCMNRGGSLCLMERPSYTITATEGKYALGDPRRAGRIVKRKFEPEECAILQGFPRDFIFKGNKSQRYEQIGNAVPPAVMEAIGKSAMEVLVIS